jgi:hypothetical protein
MIAEKSPVVPARTLSRLNWHFTALSDFQQPTFLGDVIKGL